MKKRKYKSVITKRIFQSLKKIGGAFSILFLAIVFASVSGTNSFFSDTAISGGNTMTAGYWIPPTVSVTSPDSGDEWQVGSQHDITWTAASSDPSATASMLIDIDYRCDGGSWADIATDTANDGSYTWTVEPTISDDCYVRVSATDSHGLTNSDNSDKFEISWMVVLNEFMANPVGNDDASMPNGEWVELYNNGTKSINVNGWYLYDNNDSHELQITSSNTSGGTIISSHGWLVVYRNEDSNFELNNYDSPDQVRLYDKAIVSGGILVDKVDYEIKSDSGPDPSETKGSSNTLDGDLPESNEGKTYARVPDGTGSWYDPVPTPGGKNTKSNDIDDFQEYYEDFCFDKKDRPTCNRKFMEGLGILGDENKKDETVSPKDGDDSENPASQDTEDTNADKNDQSGNEEATEENNTAETDGTTDEPAIVPEENGDDESGEAEEPAVSAPEENTGTDEDADNIDSDNNGGSDTTPSDTQEEIKDSDKDEEETAEVKKDGDDEGDKAEDDEEKTDKKASAIQQKDDDSDSDKKDEDDDKKKDEDKKDSQKDDDSKGDSKSDNDSEKDA